MLLKKYNQYLKTRRQRKIAKQVRAGLLPVGVTKEEIWEALKVTKPRNSTEMFGFLSAVVHRPDGSLKQDYGLVSVREVTTAFALRLVDALCDSAVSMAGFNQHKMGSGSTSQTSSHTALVAPQSGAQAATGGAAQGRGATSEIYQTIGTLTAITAMVVCEHGVHCASTGAGAILLDRSTVTNIDVSAEDVVTWTYQLTVTAGG